MGREPGQIIPLSRDICFLSRICFRLQHINIELAEVLQNAQKRFLSFNIYLNSIFSRIFFFLEKCPQCFNNQGSKNYDSATNKDALKTFGHYAHSLEIPDGERLCQEVPRPVPIIRKEKLFCNVNLKENLVGGIAND